MSGLVERLAAKFRNARSTHRELGRSDAADAEFYVLAIADEIDAISDGVEDGFDIARWLRSQAESEDS